MLKNKPKPSVLDSLVQEYFHLKRVEELLDSIYVEIGPYRDGEVSSETWEKVRKHFKFDDSEWGRETALFLLETSFTFSSKGGIVKR